MARKLPTSYRFSEECQRLLDELARALGTTRTGVIEQAVRKLARAELPATNVTEPPAKKGKRK